MLLWAQLAATRPPFSSQRLPAAGQLSGVPGEGLGKPRRRWPSPAPCAVLASSQSSSITGAKGTALDKPPFNPSLTHQAAEGGGPTVRPWQAMAPLAPRLARKAHSLQDKGLTQRGGTKGLGIVSAPFHPQLAPRACAQCSLPTLKAASPTPRRCPSVPGAGGSSGGRLSSAGSQDWSMQGPAHPAHTHLLRPWMQPARSLVIAPLSTVSTQTFSSVWANLGVQQGQAPVPGWPGPASPTLVLAGASRSPALALPPSDHPALASQCPHTSAPKPSSHVPSRQGRAKGQRGASSPASGPAGGSAYLIRSGLLSSLPLCSRARVQAKMLAMGLVLVGRPCKQSYMVPPATENPRTSPRSHHGASPTTPFPTCCSSSGRGGARLLSTGAKQTALSSLQAIASTGAAGEGGSDSLSGAPGSGG